MNVFFSIIVKNIGAKFHKKIDVSWRCPKNCSGEIDILMFFFYTDALNILK